MLENMPPEKLALFATQIAIEISKNKSLEELYLVRTLINQVSCDLSTIITQKIDFDRKNK